MNENSLELSKMPSRQLLLYFVLCQMGGPEVSIKFSWNRNFLLIVFRDNLLLTLPQSINNHRHLEVLLLDNNLLAGVPPVLQTVRRLQTLTVRGNFLSTPPDPVVSQGLPAILQWLRLHQPVDTGGEDKEEETMTHVRSGSKSSASREEELILIGVEELTQRRSRSRSLLRKESLPESDISDEEAGHREAWLRSRDRRERRLTLDRRKFLKNLNKRLEQRRSVRIIRTWHAWTLVFKATIHPSHFRIFPFQARIKQRRVVIKKCYAIDTICGQFWKETCYVEEESEKENATLQTDYRELFRSSVTKVIKKFRCEKIIAAILNVRSEREAFEKLCFQFAEDEESALYRY